MLPEAEGFDDDAPEVFDFLDEYLEDLEAGGQPPLSHYLRRYPGHEEAISREYLSRSDERRRAAMGSVPAPIVPPDDSRVGPYRLLSEIGRGGQGVVYLAEDTRIDRRVALKLLPPGMSLLSEDRRRRLRREAEVISRLAHPGICGIFDAEIEGELAYIAMPFVEGMTLGQAIGLRRDREARDETPGLRPPVAPRNERELFELLAFFESAARALHSAHEAGVVHRDIKPGNLMVTPEGHPVWLDFGQARDSESSIADLTMSGEIFGTPAYMAPEQIAGDPIDARTDVWALAVSLFEALTLERPFEGATSHALLLAIQTAEPRSAQGPNPTITKELDVVLRTGLERDLTRRYSSALKFAEELARIQSFEPIRARPAGPLLRVRRWAQRHPVLFVAIAGALGTLSIGLSWSLHLIGRADENLEYAIGRHLAERSDALLPEDPAAALAVGIEAVVKAPTYLTRSALYRALETCQLKGEYVASAGGRFQDIEVTPDGRFLAAALIRQGATAESNPGLGLVFDFASGAIVDSWEHAGGNARVVRCDPTGRWIATGGSDGSVHVHDSSGAREPFEFASPVGAIHALAFDDTCELLAVQGEVGPPALYQLPSGTPAGRLEGASALARELKWVPELDGFCQLPSPGVALEEILTWSRAGGAPRSVLSPSSAILWMEFRGQSLYWIDAQALLHCTAVDGRELAPALSLPAVPERVEFAPQTGWFFFATREGERTSYSMMRLDDGASFALGEPREGKLLDAAFSPGERYLSLSFNDSVVRVWDVASRVELAECRGNLNFSELEWSPDGEYLATLSTGPNSYLWFAHQLPDAYSLRAGEELDSAFFSNSGQWALGIASSGHSFLWATPDESQRPSDCGKLIELMNDPGGVVGGVFDEGDQRLLTWGAQGARLRNLAEVGKSEVLHAESSVSQGLFRPGAESVLLVTAGGEALYHRGNDEPISLGAGGRDCQRARFSSQGSLIATIHRDGMVRVWDAESCRLLMESAHSEEAPDAVELIDLVIHPNSSVIAVLGADRRVTFHAYPGGTSPYTFPLPNLDEPRDFLKVFSSVEIHWSPDGRRILVTGPEGRGAFRVAELITSEYRVTNPEVYHSDDITDGCFSDDGRLYLTSSKDGTVFIRNVEDGTPYAHIRGGGGSIRSAAFSHGEGPVRVIAAMESGLAKIWPLDPLPAALARKPRGLSDWEAARETRLALPLEYVPTGVPVHEVD